MNRLKFLREEKGIFQKDIANYLDCSIAIISMYEKELRVMDVNIAQKLAEYFDVSVDFLLGKSDIRNPKMSFNDDDLHFALSKEDKGYISDEVKNKIKEYAKFVIEQEKNKKDK